MNLKEAFRFQNKLGTLMDEAQGILGREANITKVENTYLRQKVYDGAENETVVDTPPHGVCGQDHRCGQVYDAPYGSAREAEQGYPCR